MEAHEHGFQNRIPVIGVLRHISSEFTIAESWDVFELVGHHHVVVIDGGYKVLVSIPEYSPTHFCGFIHIIFKSIQKSFCILNIVNLHIRLARGWINHTGSSLTQLNTATLKLIIKIHHHLTTKHHRLESSIGFIGHRLDEGIDLIVLFMRCQRRIINGHTRECSCKHILPTFIGDFVLTN